MRITNDIIYIGVNDHEIDLFEGQYIVPNGMAYNSYAIIDEKIAIMDTVDVRFTEQWLDNINKALEGKETMAGDIEGRDGAVRVIREALDNYVENFCR